MSMATPIRRALGLCLAVVLAGALTVACVAGERTPLAPNAKVVFLHHSTGDVIWKGGVPAWFTAYNAAHGTSYAVTEQMFPLADAGYPYANYPYDYWNIWVNHAGAAPYLGESTLEMLTAQYDIIVFKHCFPVSNIGPDTGSPDVTSSVQTVENYKLQYDVLKAKMRSFPAKRFIVWTGAAKLAVNTTPEMATRTKEFFDWVRDVWDEPGDNIYTWDFFNLETGGDIYLDPAHAASASDDHPNSTFAAEVAPSFAQRVVDVILSVADSIDTAGVADPLDELSLALAGPNPVVGPARLRFTLPVAARAELAIYDAMGRRVALLADGDSPAGPRTLTWDRGAAGVGSGVYFARLKALGRVLVQRLVILE